MKVKFLTLVVMSFLTVLAVSGQNNAKKNNPDGTWKFEAPYAPEGFTSGIITVGVAEKKYTATMAFTSSETKLSGDKVRFVNDSVYFSVYVEGQDVAVKLKLLDQTKMTGKAVYSEGEVPLTLTKVTPAQK